MYVRPKLLHERIASDVTYLYYQKINQLTNFPYGLLVHVASFNIYMLNGVSLNEHHENTPNDYPQSMFLADI